jgi:hypothetical protein
MAARCCPGVPVDHGPVAAPARPVQPATDQQLVDELALSPQDDRRPWSAPTATQARGGPGESSVPDPTLRGDSSTGQGCIGRAGWRSRPRRRCGRCQSSGLAARRSGRGACPPSAPSCLERPHGRASQTWPALPRPRAAATGRLSEGCDPPCCRRSASRLTGLPRMVGQPCAGTMRPRTRRQSAVGTWLRRPLSRFVVSSRKLVKQRVGPSRSASMRPALVSELRWPSAGNWRRTPARSSGMSRRPSCRNV